MSKIFSLDIEVINGEVLDEPVTKQFSCDRVVAEGQKMVRYFNEDMCSVVKKTFYLRVGQDLFGTAQFTRVDEFLNFRKNVCCEDNFRMLIDGCELLMDGEKVIFQ